MYSKIAPWIGDAVLEIGSGIGNLTQSIEARRLVATDFSDSYVAFLRKKFSQASHITVEKLDIAEAHLPVVPGSPFDTIVCLNVLEHIADDRQALRNMHSLLTPGGRLILLVPFSPLLHSALDDNLGHYRRYTKRSVHAVVASEGFTIDRIFLFNFFGGLGWFVSGKILRRGTLEKGSVGLFERAVPMFRLAETFGTPFGASVICVARKTN